VQLTTDIAAVVIELRFSYMKFWAIFPRKKWGSKLGRVTQNKTDRSLITVGLSEIRALLRKYTKTAEAEAELSAKESFALIYSSQKNAPHACADSRHPLMDMDLFQYRVRAAAIFADNVVFRCNICSTEQTVGTCCSLGRQSDDTAGC